MLASTLQLGCSRYWEVDDTVGADENKVPYRLEVVGVTCDPGLAVARGIWRKVRDLIQGIHDPRHLLSTLGTIATRQLAVR